MNKIQARLALLFFGSGFSALVYQIAWIRSLKLVFGASTAATGAVLAIFMGGLGFGSLLLGRHADRHPAPLRLYMKLELGISLLALSSPFLLLLVQKIYLASGGRQALGLFGSTLLRLLLSALVLGGATTLMGGSLPAASKALVTSEDRHRRGVALLYGINTLGAVLGAFCTTFFFLEYLGTRNSIFLGAGINGLVVLGAWLLARNHSTVSKSHDACRMTHVAPTNFFLTAAAFLTGFVFLLMELVWFRLLIPLLGGSTYTFGLILSVALLGLGLGGFLFSRRRKNASLSATTFLLAFFLLFPFALGDTVAVAAVSVWRNLDSGFGLLLSGFSLITFLVVFPAAMVSGYQLPLLVSLAGAGPDQVGGDVGRLYASNTFGAIAGSLAGGFFLLPLLTAEGVWRFCTLLLFLLGIAAWQFDRQRGTKVRFFPLLLGSAIVFCLFQEGPTAVWRHSQIGAGRVKTHFRNKNEVREWKNNQKRLVEWSQEGRETGVALLKGDGYSFAINGRVDGHARKDAHTQIMLGLLGPLLHPNPERGLVIGLGTGSSAGWMAQVPSIKQVDVVELEPAILKVAHDCAPANQNVLQNPKVHVTLNDAREFLPTTKIKYDVIASEPSNPYHAGVATLFTKEFFESVASKMNEDGLFLQWIPVYMVDQQTVLTLYATLASVFPAVESWESAFLGDLLLVASKRPIRYDLEELRKRLGEEPFHRGILNAWNTEGLEGVFAHFLAPTSFARILLKENKNRLNTDDQTLMEYGYAKRIGMKKPFQIDVLEQIVENAKLDFPAEIKNLDWNRIKELRASMIIFEGRKIPMKEGLKVEELVEKLRPALPIEADIIEAQKFFEKGNVTDAASLLKRAFVGYQKDPWPDEKLMLRGLELARFIAGKDKQSGEEIFAILQTPFSIKVLDEERIKAMGDIALAIDFDRLCLPLLKELEPNVPWNRVFLQLRVRCYQKNTHPLLKRGVKELGEFDSNVIRL